MALSRVHVSSKAPSHPVSALILPPITGYRRSCMAPASPAPWVNKVVSNASPINSAARSALASPPITSNRPALLKLTVATASGSGRCAAASSAAILALALAPSLLQPPVSRILTKRIGALLGAFCVASSEKSRFSCVQATTSSSPDSAARTKALASRRHSVECSVKLSLSAVPKATASSAMVWLQSQIRVVMLWPGGVGLDWVGGLARSR